MRRAPPKTAVTGVLQFRAMEATHSRGAGPYMPLMPWDPPYTLCVGTYHRRRGTGGPCGGARRPPSAPTEPPTTGLAGRRAIHRRRCLGRGKGSLGTPFRPRRWSVGGECRGWWVMWIANKRAAVPQSAANCSCSEGGGRRRCSAVALARPAGTYRSLGIRTQQKASGPGIDRHGVWRLDTKQVGWLG